MATVVVVVKFLPVGMLATLALSWLWVSQVKVPAGARVVPGAKEYRGVQFVNQKWDAKADTPFLASRAEFDRLWKQFRKGDPGRELPKKYASALADWRRRGTQASLYRAYAMAYLASQLCDRKGRPDLAKAWLGFKDNRSLEAARIVYLYHEFPVIDEMSDKMQKIALASLKRNPDDEPVQLHLCFDSIYMAKEFRAQTSKVGYANLEKAWSDPLWTAACASALINDYPRIGSGDEFDKTRAKEYYVSRATLYQLLFRYEELCEGRMSFMGSKILQKNVSKVIKGMPPLSSYPWRFGPLKGKPFSQKSL